MIKKAGSSVPRRRNSTHNASKHKQFDRGLIIDTKRVQQLEVLEGARNIPDSRKAGLSKYKALFWLFVIVVAGFIYLWVFRAQNYELRVEGRRSSTNLSSIKDVDSDYRSSVSKLVSDHYWGILPKLSEDQIYTDFLAKHPEVADIKIIHRAFSSSLKIDIELRRPVLMWQHSSGERYYVDTNGRAFPNNYTEITDSALPLVIDHTVERVMHNKVPVQDFVLNYISRFDTLATSSILRGSKVESYNLSAVPGGIDIRLTGKKYIVRVQGTNDAGQDIEELRQSLKFFTQNPSQEPSKYLDLRLTGRGFYQ